MGGGEFHPAPTPSKSRSLHLRVLTHNIRYATTSPFKGEEPWPIRRPKLCAQLLYHTRFQPGAVVFLQEALHGQLNDIRRCLEKHDSGTWTLHGVGRDDGKTAGEYSPILWDGWIWDMVSGSAETIWLNETGEVGKRGWDASSVRVLTVVVLTHQESGRSVLFMNTHLDDQGSVSRTESAKIIVKECKARRERFDVDAVVLGGDLNSETDGDAYPVLADYESSDVFDVRKLAKGEEVYGEENTFTGFDGKGDGEHLKKIDFLFLGMMKGRRSEATGYAVLPNRFEDGLYLSDHRAVVADLVIS